MEDQALQNIPQSRHDGRRVLFSSVNYIQRSPCFECCNYAGQKNLCSGPCEARGRYSHGIRYDDSHRLSEQEIKMLEQGFTSNNKHIVASGKAYNTHVREFADKGIDFDAHITKLANEGRTFKSLAEEYGLTQLSVAAIYRRVTGTGFQHSKRVAKDRVKEKAIKMVFEHGKSYTETGKALSIHPETVKKYAQEGSL